MQRTGRLFLAGLALSVCGRASAFDLVVADPATLTALDRDRQSFAAHFGPPLASCDDLLRTPWYPPVVAAVEADLDWQKARRRSIASRYQGLVREFHPS